MCERSTKDKICHAAHKWLRSFLLADTEVMTSALMQDHMLLTCLGHDLVSLTLTEHSEDPMLPTVDLDCLSGMSKYDRAQELGQAVC